MAGCLGWSHLQMDFAVSTQSWKLLRHLGTGCPVGLGIGSRILRVSPAFSIVRRIFAVIYAIFGYFWDNLPDFQQFWTDCGNFGTNFKHHLSVGFGLADQVPSRLRIISSSVFQVYLRHISCKCQSYFLHNSGICQVYLRHFSCIYQTNLNY